MDAVNIALQLAFILIFIVVLVRYLRQPRVVHRDLVLVFASVVALFAIAIALKLWPDAAARDQLAVGGRASAAAVLHAAAGPSFRAGLAQRGDGQPGLVRGRRRWRSRSGPAATC